tara:strand:- start:2384 stop:3055 length:672 start_codon:yes stop_codon:yes gene_type:complete
MSTIIKLKNVSKEFLEPRKNIVALKNINFNLKSGQCVGLLGPSGSGKTTLLQIAGLLDSQTKGEIFINNKKCDNLSEEKKNLIRKKNIGFVYQNFYLLDSFSALENVIIPQLINGINYKKAKKKAVEILSAFGLSNRLNNKPRELSAGEKQRVAISRAIANMPKIILADEPTGNLDKKNTDIVIKIIKDLVKNYKISFLIATHNLSLTKKFDNIIKLSNGRIL